MSEENQKDIDTRRFDLLTSPISVFDLATSLEMNPAAMLRWVKVRHRKRRLYIHSWKWSPRVQRWIPLWTWNNPEGTLLDAECPQRSPAEEDIKKPRTIRNMEGVPKKTPSAKDLVKNKRLVMGIWVDA